MKTRRCSLLVLATCFLTGATGMAVGAQKKGGGTMPPPDPAIVYTRNISGLYVMNADGSNARYLGLAGSLSWTVTPCFSPAGDRIAFNGNIIDGISGIYTVRTDGTDLQRVTELFTGTDYRCHLSWSPAAAPDGRQKIAYIQLNERTLWLVNPDGTGRIALVEGLYNPRGVTWSPDATRLAVADGQTLRIYTLTRNESGTVVLGGETAIVLTTQALLWPSWSPQLGTNLIAYSCWDGKSGYAANDLFVVDITDTQNPIIRNVTNTLGVDEAHPTWSPDMKQLIFHQRGKQIWIAQLNLDGTGWTGLRRDGLMPDRRRF